MTVRCIVALAVVALSCVSNLAKPSPKDPFTKEYLKERKEFVKEETEMRLGQSMKLLKKEAKLNEKLIAWKKELVEKSRDTDYTYPAAKHFFTAKAEIDASPIYKVIQKMPKGAVLHVHSSAMASLSWVIKNMTYDPNLYYMKEESKATQYKKFDENEHPGSEWKNVEEERRNSGDAEAFDDMLAKDMSIWADDPATQYSSINDVWGKLDDYFDTRRSLIPKDLDLEIRSIVRGIEEFFEDGVNYLEIRTSRLDPPFYDRMKEEVKNFKNKHPSFVGIKFIIAKNRFKTNDDMLEAIKSTLDLMKKYPNFVMGYDLVGQEDKGATQLHYINELLYPEVAKGAEMPYFFHAGETDWTQGADMNLVDAVLLNATRIGHGFAALRHPKVMRAVQKQKIAIELNPISNQVLGLVSDLRNHPGAVFFARDYPVVVSSDDPPVWMASPLSHDFYMAFMALASIDDDIRVFKKLALNSFKYSAMSKKEQRMARVKWAAAWKDFINEMNDTL